MSKLARQVFPLLISVLAAAGCSSSGGGEGGEGGEGAEGTETGQGSIPTALQAVESGAEDAYDLALASKFDDLRATAATVDTQWKAFRAQAVKDGAPASNVAAMDAAVDGLKTAAASPGEPAALARTANRVSAPMDVLFGLYDPAVPSEVLKLDYLGRELALDGVQDALDGATGHLSSLSETWTALRPEVVSAGGDKAAADFDASVKKLQAALGDGNASALTDEANVNLELVDALEKVFE